MGDPLKTLFNNVPKTTNAAGDSPANKRLSVEKIYQKKSQLEHILLRPDTYIGSVDTQTTQMWVYNSETGLMEQRELTFVPGLYKIFDEILVNAADNKQRDANMDTIKIDVDPENNRIKIWNNGKGIPVVEHKDEKMYVPTLIFGHLLTSSNYNDFEKKVTGGRNGYGAKLCNIYSKKFTVETSCKQYKKAFKQIWTDNMGKASDVKISDAKDEDFTCITFEPDLARFKMEKLDKDIVDLFTRRAYDIAASSKGVKVYLNGKKLPVKGFRDYIDLYLKDKTDEQGQPLKVVYESVNPRWEIAVALSAEKGFQQVSFVNSIATTKGGRHVDYIVDQLTKQLSTVVAKKSGKGSVQVKPFQIKNNMWVFLNCLIENPAFDSQTKENMTLQAKQFGSKCDLSEKFINQVTKCGIIEHILNWVKFKEQSQLNKKSGAKTSKLKGIPKLDDANEAGTKNSEKCTLILTEGDSAKTLAVAGLSVIGRDHFGVFPLRGKLLNVREASHKQIMENAEINSIIKILGLQYQNKYTEFEDLKKLRYGKLMIMTDQDQDGSHIKGLLINFIHTNWPNLLKHNFIVEFITPIVKASKNKKELSFYSIPEFDEWKQKTDNWHTYKIKYYKGLGTSTSKEAKEYFSDMTRHRIPFKYDGPQDDQSINLAFSKKCCDERKEWLSNWMQARKQRLELGLNQDFLYGKDTKRITFTEFVNKELILFSNLDNERSIPSLVDGLKPGQRKVLFTCIKRNLIKEIKVAQLAGSVAEISAYHHGEQSLMDTIIKLAQNYVGSNNLNLLEPIGQFGTRLHGGKDSASPRYIFTALSELTRVLFHPHDDAILNYLNDDGAKIEPFWYSPILPTILINGCTGIGTGWSTNVPNFDTREVCENVKRLIRGEETQPMRPSYRGFRGGIEQLEDQRFFVNGEVAILEEDTIEITELPVGTWTQYYKESVLEPYLVGTEKIPQSIQDYKEYHTDTTVRFVVKMSKEQFKKAEDTGFHNFFKLQTVINTSNMVLFDANGVLKQYESPEAILQEFYTVRLDMYGKRKAFLDGMLDAESRKLSNQARFILEKIEGKIVVENKKKKELIENLVSRGYESDPVKEWKNSQGKEPDEPEQEADDGSSASSASGPDFLYLFNMPILSLTKEKKDELLRQRDEKKHELDVLRGKTSKDLWLEDLDVFIKSLDKYEKEQAEADKKASADAEAKAAKGRVKAPRNETLPSRHGTRIPPAIPTEKLKSAKGSKKSKTDTKQNKLDAFGFGGANEDGEVKELEDSPVGKKEVVKKPAEKKKSVSPRKPKVVKKKANPWDSGSESEGPFDSSLSDGAEQVIPREKTGGRQAAAKKAKYNFSDSESTDDELLIAGGKSPESPTKPVSKTAAKKASNSLESDDDLTVAGGKIPEAKKLDSPAKPVSKPTTKKSASKSLESDDDVIALSDDDSDFGPKKKTAKASAPKSKSAKDTEKANKAEPKKRAQPAKAKVDNKQPKLSFAAITTKKTTTDSAATKLTSDSGEDGKASAKEKAAPKRKKADAGSDLSDIEIPVKKKPTVAKKKAGSWSDEDLDDENAKTVAPRATTARARNPVKYNIDSDSDSDF